MSNDDLSRPPDNRSFERKVRRAKWAFVFEQLWLRVWVLLAIMGLFVLVSFAGLWPRLGQAVHIGLLAVFGLALLAWLVYAARITWPSRESAIRRIERVSGVPHRPASSYEDTLTASAHDPATASIWRAHRERMAALLSRLKAGTPHPRTDRFDPFAVRALLILFVVLLTALAGDRALDHIRAAFRIASLTGLAEARLDAWVTPPAYTGRPPMMLADGANPVARSASPAASGAPAEVPERSVVIVRSSGIGAARLALEITSAAQAPVRLEAETRSGPNDVQELRYELQRSATIRALGGTTELARWQLEVIPDSAPMIALTRPPEQTPRGSMKLTYRAEDDYGLASARVKLEKVKPAPADPSKAWAHPEPPKGPRPPLRRLPALDLRLPQANAKEAQAHTYIEFASHPWAGLKVIMTLEAADVAGQVGRSGSIEMVLPERRFTKPLARAVVEQRRKLLDDPRFRGQVMRALDALTLEPETSIDDIRVYLGLRSAYHRLAHDRSGAGMTSVIEQLWHIALRIEDGSLSDAERALRDAQERLAKALESGASDEEIERLMQELRHALDDYMKQLARESEGGEPLPEGQNQDNQVLGQQDLERMMRNIEEMAKNGSREQAQQLLSEMRDLMERMQSGRMSEAEAQHNRQMMEMLDELGDMVGDQQQLMDDTFSERRQPGEQQGQRPPPGTKGMGGEARKGEQGDAPQGPNRGQRAQRGQGQRGQRGQGQQGELGQGDDLGQMQSQGQGRAQQLSERQRELRERLSRLQREMRDKRAGSADGLDQAREAMEGAAEALERGDLEQATEEQARALDQMRQGAQSMAQEMLRNMPQRYGQSGDAPRDPLGRPQRSQGPDLGTSVKVPDEIDIQRAREILEELRRRLGEATRPTGELDYLERLLRRF